MKQILDAVEEFHESFGHPIAKEPHEGDKELVALRYDLMQEENKEYVDAYVDGDLVGIADALGDQLYILAGTIIAHGMQDIIVDVFNEIQRSNMSKLGTDGKPIYREDGKILKGENYSAPELESIVNGK